MKEEHNKPRGEKVELKWIYKTSPEQVTRGKSSGKKGQDESTMSTSRPQSLHPTLPALGVPLVGAYLSVVAALRVGQEGRMPEFDSRKDQVVRLHILGVASILHEDMGLASARLALDAGRTYGREWRHLVDGRVSCPFLLHKASYHHWLGLPMQQQRAES